MARSDLADAKRPLSRALGAIARSGAPAALALVWSDAVGAALAARSRPVLFRDAILTVVADPEFIPDLERERETLCRRLNARLGRGAVHQIRYLKEGHRP